MGMNKCAPLSSVVTKHCCTHVVQLIHNTSDERSVHLEPIHAYNNPFSKLLGDHQLKESWEQKKMTFKGPVLCILPAR